jgi:hypothetical protein
VAELIAALRAIGAVDSDALVSAALPARCEAVKQRNIIVTYGVFVAILGMALFNLGLTRRA